MANIYQLNGQDVYDNNGATYNAKTGALIAGNAAPPNPFAANAPSIAFGATNTNQPIVAPNQNGSLQGTAITPTSSTIPPPASNNGTPTTSTTPTANTTTGNTSSAQGLDPGSFTALLGNINNGLQQNNAVVDQKNAVVQALLGNTVDPATLSKLPPDIQSVIQSGNRGALLLQAQILNNSIQGKNDATASSIKYLTQGYQISVEAAEKQKQDAINNVLNFAKTYGSGAGAALSSLYGPQYVQQLKDMGINVDSFSSQSTLDEQTAAAKANPTPGLSDPSLNEDISTVDPASQSILAQTGLSVLAFNYLTQGTSALSRLSATDRQAVFKEAENFLNKEGLDYSTFQANYKAQTDVLQKNIERAANTKIFAGEVSGTAQQFIDDVGNDLGNLKPTNVAKLFATGQANDPTTQKYKFDLQTMQNDLAGYYAASRGSTSPDQSDLAAAASVITNGLSAGGAQAFKDSIDSNEAKVNKVVSSAVADAQKSIWTQFGVGDKYQPPKDSNIVSIPKGSMSDSAYVDKVLSAQGLKYDDVIKTVPSGKKGVINNGTGEIGVIDPSEFDPSIYTSL